MVDVCNWCSLEFQVPYGLYDLSKVSGPIELRVGHAGEAYAIVESLTTEIGPRMAGTPAYERG